MPWGVIVHQYAGRVYSFVMANDNLYDGVKEDMLKNSIDVVGGKKGIDDSDIDNISGKVSDLVNRVNAGEKLNLNKELGHIF